MQDLDWVYHLLLTRIAAAVALHVSLYLSFLHPLLFRLHFLLRFLLSQRAFFVPLRLPPCLLLRLLLRAAVLRARLAWLQLEAVLPFAATKGAAPLCLPPVGRCT